jgi:hypothetical protein
MPINIACHDGTISIDTNAIRVLSPFNKLLWSTAYAEVTRITRHHCMLLCDFTIHTQKSSYTARAVVRREAEQLLALFPGLVVDESVEEQKWYLDPRKHRHIALYSDRSALQEELQAAQRHGWEAEMVDNSLPLARNQGEGPSFSRLRFHLERHSNKEGVITVKFVRKPYWRHQ